MTVSAAQALARYGDPSTEKSMVLYDVPARLEVGGIPKRIYCNRDLQAPLSRAFELIVKRGLADLIRTWDGCFQVRKQRGSSRSMSLHSWGLAVDLNQAWNRLGEDPQMDKRLVACFEESGFEWGGRWKRKDGMHFQLAKLPEG